MSNLENKTDKYKLILQVRNFHYDNFNKWMTYYYIAIGSLFIGLLQNKEEYKTLILILGSIISIMWHISCKGYYFWILNWTYLIHKEEEEMQLRIHSGFSQKVEDDNKLPKSLNPIKAANFSTSKITLLFSFIVSVSWFIYLLIK